MLATLTVNVPPRRLVLYTAGASNAGVTEHIARLLTAFTLDRHLNVDLIVSSFRTECMASDRRKICSEQIRVWLASAHPERHPPSAKLVGYRNSVHPVSAALRIDAVVPEVTVPFETVPPVDRPINAPRLVSTGLRGSIRRIFLRYRCNASQLRKQCLRRTGS
jgi:hypothetical protein